MKCVVLFGAGASAFSGPPPEQCPPLGDGLFDRLCAEDGFASTLPEEIKEIFRKERFEAGMAAVMAMGSRYVAPLQWQISLHLAKYETQSRSYYVWLLDLLQRLGVSKRIKEICFSTLNYDLLLEQAIAISLEKSICYWKFAEADRDALVSVLKLHGSVNFLAEIPGLTMKGCSFGPHVGKGWIEGAQIHLAESADEIAAFARRENELLVPTMAVYTKGKKCLTNSSVLDQIQEEWRLAVRSANLIVLIGVRYVADDVHIWNPMMECGARLAIVNPHPDELLNWSRKNRSGGEFALASGFDETVPIALTIREALR